MHTPYYSCLFIAVCSPSSSEGILPHSPSARCEPLPPPLLLVGWRTPENKAQPPPHPHTPPPPPPATHPPPPPGLGGGGGEHQKTTGRPPPHPRTRAQRHNLTLRARCKHTAPRALEHLVGEHGLELTHSGAKRSDLVLKIKHAADALETHPLARKLGNLAKLCDVAYRVPARTAARAGRGNQTQPVVLPKGLRMHPRQLGSNRDDKHRTRCIHESLYPRALARRSSRGFSSGSCSANS